MSIKSLISRLPAELGLVLTCCRWPSSDDASAEVVRLSASSLNWSSFKAIVARHRVEGLVHNSLRRAAVSPPAEVALYLERSATAIARSNLAYAAESMRLQAKLNEAGIRFIYVKGVTLNILAYNSLAYKHACDIDVAVDPAAYLQACRLMSESGYVRVIPDAQIEEGELTAWLEKSKHTVWLKPGTGLSVEVHIALVDNPLILPSLSVISEPQLVEVGPGMALPTLNEEELFSYLCVHGSAHGWARIKWLADLAALLSGQSEDEVERLYRCSIELGAGRSAAQALLLCCLLLGLPLKQSLEKELRSDRATMYMVRVGIKTIARGGGAIDLDDLVLGTIPIHLSHFLMLPGWPYKFKELRRKLAPSNGPNRPGGALATVLLPLYRPAEWLLSRSKRRRVAIKARSPK